MGALDKGVEVVDVGLMVLAVVVVEGADGDLVGELVFGVGELWENEGHKIL